MAPILPLTTDRTAGRGGNLRGRQCIHARILAHASSLPDHSVLRNMRTEEFVFDVFKESKGGEVQLLEINPFGATSGCDSCLFHWIDEADLLYGNSAQVGVRLAM